MWQVYLPLALFLPRCERDSTTDGEAPPVVGIPGPVRRPAVVRPAASPTMAPVQRARFDLHNPRHLVGLVVAVAMWVVVIALSDPTVDVSDPFSGHVVTAQDARSYYGLNLADLYTGRSDWNSIGAYPYSPAFAQLVYPLDLLPWPVFVAAWTALLIGAVYWLTGPDLFLLGLLVGAMEIAGGNITLLLAVAIVAGFRRPWTWAFVILTKITPGVALIWFALRREWRPLVIALGSTASGAGSSRSCCMPGQWRSWVELLDREPGQGRHVGGDPDPAADPRTARRAADHLGRAAQPALDGAGRRDARAAGPVVRLAVDAAGRDPAHDADRARPSMGARALVLRRGRRPPA